MKKENLASFNYGKFIGNFEGAIYNTNLFEMTIKNFGAGERELKHLHKISKQILVILHGALVINAEEYKKNDILFMNENEICEIDAKKKSKLLIITIPSVKDDTYIVFG